MTDIYDVFISHASEDKESVAKPLAEELVKLGLNVWLDEFILEVGDSLMESIDKGLVNSKFGIVVLSQPFLSKGWTKYELRSLVTREVGRTKVILPLWHKVRREEIEQFSPALADKIALDTAKQSLGEISLHLLKAIRPDIFKNLTRYAAWLKAKSNAELKYLPITEFKEIKLSPIRHPDLSSTLLIRAKLIYKVLGNSLGQTLEQFIQNFQRDLHPHEEIQIWERIAVTYLDVVSESKSSSDEMQTILVNLLSISMQSQEKIEEMLRSDEDYIKRLIVAYMNVAPPIPSADLV